MPLTTPGRSAARALRAGLTLAVLLTGLTSAAARGSDDAPEERPPSTLSTVRIAPADPADPLSRAGSRSVGTADDGFLVDAATLPFEGDGWYILPAYRDRGLRHATDELVAAIPRAAATVRATFPDAVLQVGNLSGRHGGPLSYSRSHQNGRDVDLGFYAHDEAGAPARPDELVPYRCNLRSRDRSLGLRFDVPRNWALVAALLSDDAIQVQLILIMPCLRRALLAHAREIEADETLRARAAAVLRGPGRRSYAHDDHFHVRLYCTRDDLMLGCRNDGRVWPWIATHEGSLDDDRAQLSARLRAEAAEVRRAALETIAREDHKPLARRVLRLLDDPDPEVRTAALATTRRLAAPGALSRLRRRIRRSRDATEVLALVRALRAFEAPARRTAALLEGIARRPGDRLTARLDGDQARAIRVAAIDALAFVHRRRTPRVLFRLLTDDAAAVREAAERSLTWLTNHRLDETVGPEPAARRAAWEGWWAAVRRQSGDRRVREGFLAAGVELPRSLYRWGAVRPLIDLIPRGGALSWNAQQVLRRFADDNAPRIPHDHPERTHALWWAWLGSRLAAGALDGDPAAPDAPEPGHAPAP